MLRIFLMVILALNLATLINSKPQNALKTDIDAENEDPNVTPDYRLPVDLMVLDYRVHLEFPEKSLTEEGSEFSGTSSVTFQHKNKVKTVKIHVAQEYLNIKEVILMNNNVTEKYTYDNETGFLSATLARDLNANSNITMSFKYTGKMGTIKDSSRLSTKDSGVNRAKYVNSKNEAKHVIFTHFEPTRARTVFPCFDEPHLKAQFDFTFTVPKNVKVLFNTPELKEEKESDNSLLTFQRTPAMSTYLVAFVISEEYDCSSGAELGKNIKSEVCSRPETKSLRDFPVAQGPKIVNLLETYTGIKYGDNIGKLSQVAVPEFRAMENWGLIIYGEKNVLYDDDQTTNVRQQFIQRVMAHEISHQWFGNLITCKWWSELFLNEGLARYFEWFVSNKLFENWEMDKQFITTNVHKALAYDSKSDVNALNFNVTKPEEIFNKADTISYEKGASILHMISNIMRSENFQKGIKNYLNNINKYAESSDLWTALQANIDNKVSNIPDKVTFLNVMENWTKLPGYPLLQVAVKDGKVAITQERFLASGEDKKSKWYVPVTYTTSTTEKKFESTNPAMWLKPEDESVTFDLSKDDTWVILNNQQSAYYRVNYDDSLWAKIKTGLSKEKFDGIHELNRAQIVDDGFSLYEAGKLNFEQVVNITEFLKNDVSLYAWTPAISHINYIYSRIYQTELRKKIQEHVVQLIENLYNSVPLNETDNSKQVYTVTQTSAATLACNLGHQACIEHANQIFKSFKDSGTKLSKEYKNIKEIVYCNAIRHSDNNSNWDAVWNAYTKETVDQERVTFLTALGCTKDTNQQKKLLKMVTDSDSKIQSTDIQTLFASVYTGSNAGVSATLNFVLDNYAELETQLGVSGLVTVVKGLSDKINMNLQLAKLKSFLEDKKDLPEEFKTAAQSAVTEATTNIEWMTKYGDALYKYYDVDKKDEKDDTSFAIVGRPTVLIMILCSFVVYFELF